jgi:hypothetical protein
MAQLKTVANTGPKVWVYPERTWEPLGSERWEVEWYELTDGARKRFAADPNYEHDHDRDEIAVVQHFKTHASARRFAKKVVETMETVYGCATVTKQVVDWYVEEDRVAEWADVGEEPEYFP